MKYILDTNTVSFVMRGDANVSRRLTSHDRTEVFLPQPVVAEIEYGLARLPRSARKKRLVERFEMVCDEIQRLIWTDDVSRFFGATKADLEKRGLRLEDFDVATAAHALALDATLVSDNVAHMERIRALRLETGASESTPDGARANQVPSRWKGLDRWDQTPVSANLRLRTGLLASLSGKPARASTPRGAESEPVPSRATFYRAPCGATSTPPRDEGAG